MLCVCYLGATGGHSFPIYTHPLPKTGRIACDRFSKKRKKGENKSFPSGGRGEKRLEVVCEVWKVG